jgi:hypothetical protein
MDCHKEVGKDVAELKGHHGRIDTTKDCKECHAEHKGRRDKVSWAFGAGPEPDRRQLATADHRQDGLG